MKTHRGGLASPGSLSWSAAAPTLLDRPEADTLHRRHRGGPKRDGKRLALISLHDVSLAFDTPLMEGAGLHIETGERLCLLGRNGAGKSSLLRILHGVLRPDSGTVTRQPLVRVALLAQDLPTDLRGTVRDVVAADVPAAVDGPPVVDIVMSRMQLDPEATFQTLSVGLRRRTLLARALATEPDVLLLDEPTNHLDLDAILWLETFLLQRRGALLFITHDRALTHRLATRILELERGRLSSWSCDYATFLRRREAQLEAEAAQQRQFDDKLRQEEAWIRQGIQARRTRNEGRVRALVQLREERQRRRLRTGAARMTIQQGEATSRRVIEAEEIGYAFEDNLVIDGFSLSVMRGDKIGLVGANGSGKTTLLRLLLGDLEPQRGTIRRGLRLQVAYFDQLRDQLDDEQTVFDSIAGGSDRVTVNGHTKHVYSYLQDFLFTPDQSRGRVGVLSGGERNRLLLARLFTRPANLLALDEPTNDLDAESLEVLEAMLVDFSGTVLFVSHDRAFLDNVATSTIAFEGPSRIKEYVGGYSDWLRPQPPPADVAPPAARAPAISRPRQRARKLTYNETRELDSLPGRIDTLETELRQLQADMGDPARYTDGTDISALTARHGAAEAELATAYARWEELEGLLPSPGE